MSFLSGIANLGRSAVKLFSGNSVWGSLAKTALLGYAVNRLSKSALKGNNTGPANIDQGVRLQVRPNAESKIPVLYGSAFFGGNISDAAMTNNNKTMWYCLVLSEKTGNLYSTSSASTYTFNDIYWNNQRIVFESDGVTVNYTVDTNSIVDRSLSGLVKIYCYAGGRTAGQVPSGYTGTVPNAETLFPNWTSGTHAMSNLIFALVRVDYNRERNVTGIGDMLFQVTNSMNKPGDVVYDYLTNTAYGCGISAGDILTADVTALNSYSAQSVAYADQGTGAQTLANRYQINGLIDTDRAVLENAESILNACASWLSYDSHDGKWGIVINKTDSSVAAFNDSNILGSISLSGTGLQDLYNTVKVEFPHRELRDSADFYNISVPTSSIPADWTPFSRNLNEEDNVLNLTYDIINEPVQAQMLGLIELKQSRIDKVIQFEVDFSYYNLKAGDIVSVTNTRFGFSSKLFRIINIVEVQEDNIALSMRITALEYDSNVYSVADLYRFTRSNVDGIITIGSIGTPGTPSITKIERDARPRIEISSTAPTGVVEGMEFWLTTDVTIPADENRSYTLIGIQRPAGGGVFTSGTAVVLEYTTASGNFLVKTRGFNATTVGPYSNVSGLIEFAPVQVTDALGPDTGAVDEFGNLLTALAIVDLLKLLDELYQGVSGAGSIFDEIFKIFEDVTGIDIVGESVSGELVIKTNVKVKENEIVATENLSELIFKGDCVTVNPVEGEPVGTGKVEVNIECGLTPEQLEELYPSLTVQNYESSDLCAIDGFIAVGDKAVPFPPIATNKVTCNGQLDWSVDPFDANGNTINNIPTKTGPTGGFYFVTYSVAPGSFNVSPSEAIGFNWTVQGFSPSGFNGTYLCTSRTVDSNGSLSTITLRYPTNPGTYSSGAGSGTVTRIAGSPSRTQLKPMFIKNDTSTNGSYTLSITPNQGKVLININSQSINDTFFYAPTNISGIKGTSDWSGTSSTPLVITGSYNCINQILQSRLYWSYTFNGNAFTVPIPPPSTSVTINVSITANGVTKTHTETMNYVSYSTLYPWS